MTRVYDVPRQGGATRLLVLGAAAYPFAGQARTRVPKLADIPSAGRSALSFAYRAIERWQHEFVRPLASVDLLVNAVDAPDGTRFTDPAGQGFALESPSLDRIKTARRAWMQGAGPNDVLIFYCCGHGIWLPSTGRTFLTTSFGEDDENPWPATIALDDFAFALAEYAPRQQWLIFDCCSNTPSAALRAVTARADPLLVSVEGARGAIELQYGMLSQVIVASASPGAKSFGKVGRCSRFMEAFLEACDGSGSRRQADGKWWVDQVGIEEAIATYRLRVAPIEEEDYFTFPRVTQTDAPEVPRFLGRETRPNCILLIRSEPPYMLKRANLTVRCRITSNVVGTQPAGAAALARYRLPVDPWREYDIEARYADNLVPRSAFAIPPLADVMF